MTCHLQKPCGWWNAAAFHQPLLSLSPTKNVNYTLMPSVREIRLLRLSPLHTPETGVKCTNGTEFLPLVSLAIRQSP